MHARKSAPEHGHRTRAPATLLPWHGRRCWPIAVKPRQLSLASGLSYHRQATREPSPLSITPSKPSHPPPLPPRLAGARAEARRHSLLHRDAVIPLRSLLLLTLIPKLNHDKSRTVSPTFHHPSSPSFHRILNPRACRASQGPYCIDFKKSQCPRVRM